eukprot:gene23715-28744_t
MSGSRLGWQRGIPGADVRVSAGGDSAIFPAPMSGSRLAVAA